MNVQAITDILKALGDGGGPVVAALAIAAWWYERRQVNLMHRQLYRATMAGLQIVHKEFPPK